MDSRVAAKDLRGNQVGLLQVQSSLEVFRSFQMLMNNTTECAPMS